jgi:hypothetical protein
VVGERRERSWNAIAQGRVGENQGSQARDGSSERVVSWLLVAPELSCVFTCVVLAKPSTCFSHCWVDT